MRFIFCPAEDAAYDWRMLRGLSGAVAAAGHKVKLLPPNERTLQNLVHSDIIFDINHARPGWLPAHVQHVAWVQDFRPGVAPHYGERKRPGDLTYVLTNPDAQGVDGKYVDGALLTGVDPKLLELAPTEPSIDLSLCGYVPPPFEEIAFDEVQTWVGPISFAKFCHDEIEKRYTPLCGDLRCLSYYADLHEAFMHTLKGRYNDEIIENAWRKLLVRVGHWTMDHPRRLDRIKLAGLMLKVSDNCLFQGKNWPEYKEFASRAAPHTNDEYELYRVYQGSKINLHTNSDGYGPHSRVLEAMAVGGFIMTHAVKYPEKSGCMSGSFTPGTHYGEFTADNFVEQAKFWLQNTVAREWAIQECRGLIEGRHLWRHRAAQLLKDLGLPNHA